MTALRSTEYDRAWRSGRFLAPPTTGSFWLMPMK